MSNDSTETKLYDIAESQAGFFSARQAQQAGYSKALLSHHTQRGKFLRIRRGVYRLKHFPEQPHSDLFAAWLAVGEKAVLSHESALALYDLSDLIPAEVHLTVPRSASHRLSGVRLHTGKLSPDEITQRHGLPVTSLPRTLADLLRLGVESTWVEQAVQQSLARGLVSKADLRLYAKKRSGQLADIVESALTENEPG